MRQIFAVMGCAVLLAGCAGEAPKQPTGGVPMPVGMVLPTEKINSPPIYPGFEAVYGMEGTTMLLIRIGADGTPLHMNIVSTAGWRNLDQAALNAVSHWRFTPEIKNGVAVESNVKVPVQYSDTFKDRKPWPALYRAAPFDVDEAPFPYSTVSDAVAGVAAKVHEPVYNGRGPQYHAYVVYDENKVMRERWYFTDIFTPRAMAVRYTFAGTPDHPVTKVSALCNDANLCQYRMRWIMVGPYSIRSAGAE